MEWGRVCSLVMLGILSPATKPESARTESSELRLDWAQARYVSNFEFTSKFCQIISAFSVNAEDTVFVIQGL